MEQRVKTLWNFTWGCEIIDLEHGYALVCFYTLEDYYHVLEQGLWIVLGHYLTVAK